MRLLVLLSVVCFSAFSTLPPATELDNDDMNRCLASLHSAKNQKLTNEKLWMGDFWQEEKGGEGHKKPFFKTLNINQNDSPPDMSIFSEYKSGCMIGKGTQIFISFPGAALGKKLQDYAVLKRRSQDFSSIQDGRYWSYGLSGRGHWGAFQICRCYTKNIEDDIRKYASNNSFELNDLQIIFSGHSFGGMIAQYAAIDLINRIFIKNPKQNARVPQKRNNVIVVSLGAPAVFNSVGRERWNTKIGGSQNHLRIMVNGDSIGLNLMQSIQAYDTPQTTFGRALRGTWKRLSGLVNNEEVLVPTEFTGKELRLPMSGTVDFHGLRGAYTPAFEKKYGYKK